MERLTDKVRNFDGTASAKESLIDEYYHCPSDYCSKILTKLADYEDKEEQGLLIELPCKVGDTLYINDFRCYWQKEYDRPYEVVVIRIVINAFRVYIDVLLEDGMQYQFNLSDIGKIIFFTLSEAEEALTKMGGK